MMRASPEEIRKAARAATCCANFNLRKASRALGQVYDAALRPLGLKGTQFSLLTALALTGPADQVPPARSSLIGDPDGVGDGDGSRRVGPDQVALDDLVGIGGVDPKRVPSNNIPDYAVAWASRA